MTLGLRIDGGNPGNQGTLDFLAPVGASFDLAPETAVKFFQDKGLKTSFAWQDMMRQEHAKAFTIAKMMDADMLKDMKALIDQAIAQGESLRWFQERATPYLQSKGWWGKQLVTDPLTGAQVTAQLGSAARLETIFRTNMMSAYAVGQWEQIQAQKAEAPYLLYDAIDDGRTRPEHRALDGVVRKVDDAFWKTHTPPLAWNCRCHLIQLSDDELEQFGIEKKAPPKETKGIWINPRTGKKYTLPISPETGRFVVEPGFDYNPGEHYLKKLAKLAAEKAAQDQAAANAIKKAAERAAKLKAKTEAEAAAQDALKMMVKELGAVELERSKNKVALRIAKEKAKTELALIAKGHPTQDPGGFKKKAFKQLSKIPGWENGTPEAQLSAVKAKAEQLKQHHANLTKLSAYKKNVLAGKAPTPAQKAAFDTLSADEQAAFLAKLDAEKAKIAAKATKVPNVEPDFEFERLTQIGGQAGSNPGGLYQDTETGAKFYIKFPKTEDIARNEILAGHLYRAAGVPNVAETLLFKTRDGRIGVASKFVEGLARSKSALTGPNPPTGVFEGFVADAWLANWDVVGLGYDNLLMKAGQAYRIDTGGALRYRAQGTPKGSAFVKTVQELDTLRDPKINPNTAAVFGPVPKEQLVAGAKKIASITDEQIDDLVNRYSGLTKAKARELAEILKARRDDLIKRLIPEKSEAFRAAQQAAIKAETNDIQFQLQELDDRILTAIKGIAKRANDGGVIEQKDIDRVSQAYLHYHKIIADKGQFLSDETLSKIKSHYLPWLVTLEEAVKDQLGRPAKWTSAVFKGFQGAIQINPEAIRVVLPKPGAKPLFSNEEAAQILKKTIGVTPIQVQIPQGRSGYEAFRRLPEEHQRAITAYTGGYYQKINPALRGEEGTIAEQHMIPLRDLINQALDLVEPYVGKSSRGLKFDAAARDRFVKLHQEALQTGKEVTYNAFTSTTRGEQPAFSGQVILHITGKTGRWVKPISLHPSEDEVLFKAGTRFLVVQIVEKSRYETHIYLNEISP